MVLLIIIIDIMDCFLTYTNLYDASSTEYLFISTLCCITKHTIISILYVTYTDLYEPSFTEYSFISSIVFHC